MLNECKMDDVKSKMSNGRQKSKGIYQIQTNKMDLLQSTCVYVIYFKNFL